MSLTFYPRDFKMSTSRDEYDGNFCNSVGHRILCGVLDTLDEHFILAYKSNELHYLYNQVRDDWGRPWLLDGNTPPAWITYWLVKLKEKQTWMEKTELICKEVRNKVSDKSWVKVKPVKTNPRPIEFPQDVFNVIKDYMDIVDVPTPVWDEMMSKSIKEISTHRKYKGTGPDYYKPFPEGTNLRKVKVAEKRQRYFVGIIKQAKKKVVRYYEHMKYMGRYTEENRHFYGRHWIKEVEFNGTNPRTARGAVIAYVGWEATNYTMMVNHRVAELLNVPFEDVLIDSLDVKRYD
jgi:hypothetical protein